MTEFTKAKMSFVLALLGTLFVLRPFLEEYGKVGFRYLGYELTIAHAYAIVAGSFALSVYFFAVAIVSERPHSISQAAGNLCYAVALMVPPLFGGLYIATVLAAEAGQHWAVSAPAVALALGLGWFAFNSGVAWFLRRRMSEHDERSKAAQLEHQEVTSLDRARDLFLQEHYDLSVIEAWRAIEARLRRVLMARGLGGQADKPQVMIKAAVRAGLLRPAAENLLQELRRQWNVAISTEPLTREAADKALKAARDILATIPLEKVTPPQHTI